jgi:uncharacterized protein involved in outer membrane biogenesis
MKKLLLIGVGLVVLIIIGATIAVRVLINPERVRATIASQASAALGMPVTLQAADVSVWPRARVTLRGLRVGEPASLTLDTIEVATALGALLSRRIENAELTIADSTVDLPAVMAALERLAKETPPAPAGTATDAPLTLVSIDTIAFRNVRVAFDDETATVSLESALDGDRLDLRSLDLTSTVTTLKAAGAIDSLSQRRGNLSISAESLDLDGMVALLSRLPGTDRAQPAQSPQRAQPFDLTLDVTAAKGRAAGVQFNDLKTTIHATASGVQLEPFALGVFAGRVDGKVRVDTSRPQPALVLDTRLSGIDMRAVTAFAGHPEAITGRLGGDLHLTGLGTEPATALANAAGRGTFAITDGVMPNLHLVRDIVLAFGKPAPQSSGGGDRFTRIAATMQLSGNVLRFTDLIFAAPDVDVTAGGTLNLSGGQIQVAGQAMLSEALTAQAGRDLVRFTAENNRVTLPVSVTGGIAAPHVTVDTGAVLRRAAENEVKSQIQKQTGSLFERLTKPKKKP